MSPYSTTCSCYTYASETANWGTCDCSSTWVSSGTVAYYGDCDASTSTCWVSGGDWSYISFGSDGLVINSEPETEEQKAIREAEELRQQEEREVAVKVAEELLKKHIGLERFGELNRVGHIEVDSHKYKGRKYRVPDDERMIEVLEDGQVVDRLCIHTAIDCPNPDKVLARLVLLESAEEILLAQANHHGA